MLTLNFTGQVNVEINDEKVKVGYTCFDRNENGEVYVSKEEEIPLVYLENFDDLIMFVRACEDLAGVSNMVSDKMIAAKNVIVAYINDLKLVRSSISDMEIVEYDPNDGLVVSWYNIKNRGIWAESPDWYYNDEGEDEDEGYWDYDPDENKSFYFKFQWIEELTEDGIIDAFDEHHQMHNESLYKVNGEDSSYAEVISIIRDSLYIVQW